MVLAREEKNYAFCMNWGIKCNWGSGALWLRQWVHWRSGGNTLGKFTIFSLKLVMCSLLEITKLKLSLISNEKLLL